MMAFILFLVGGIAGVIAMLTSIVAFDASFLAALAVWFAAGMIISLAGIALASVPQGRMHNGRMIEA
jgi:hypothetical protein